MLKESKMTGKSSDGTYREHEIPSIAVAQAEAIASENADPGESSGGGPPAGSAQQSNQSDLQRTIRGSREGKQRWGLTKSMSLNLMS